MKNISKILLLVCSTNLLLYSCISNNQSGYEVTLSDSDLKYVPTTSNHLDDKTYINEIDILLTSTATSIDNEQNFIDIIKAIAWTETKWEHYFKRDNKYYVLLGDDGHSFGIMQIDEVYHGVHAALQDNVEYGITFAFEKYQAAVSTNCPSGTNSGTSITAIARRTYAQYNGGDDAMCRDNNARDNNLEDALNSLPWNSYLL